MEKTVTPREISRVNNMQRLSWSAAAVAAALALLCACSGSSDGNDADTPFTVSGTVAGTNGEKLQGAVVAAGPENITTVSGDNGSFFMQTVIGAEQEFEVRVSYNSVSGSIVLTDVPRGAAGAAITFELNGARSEIEARNVRYIGDDQIEPAPQPTASPAQPESAPVCSDECGDGVCAELVCLAEGCPCAEDIDSCPADCRTPAMPAILPEACINFCGDGICAEEVCLADGCPCAEDVDSCPGDCRGAALPAILPEACVDFCGDGECAQEVCLAEGCPCAESQDTCPADCGLPDSAPACVNECGDGVCVDMTCFAADCPCPESSASCPADCPA